MEVPDVTLTTSCFDLTSFNDKSRSLFDCVNNMKALLEVPIYLVIYADSKCMPMIKEMRAAKGLESITVYHQIEVNELGKYKYSENIRKTREYFWPLKDDRSSVESHIIQISKPDLVLNTMDENPFNTSKFGWIDSNLGKDNFSKICENYKEGMLVDVLNKVSNKFHLQILNVCDKKYKNVNNKQEMFLEYRWMVCGCFFTTSKDKGIFILDRLNDIIDENSEKGLGHGEEMFYLDILDEFYDDIHRSYGDYHHILNNFSKQTTGWRYVRDLIINGYRNKAYHRECYDCCRTLLDSIDNTQVNFGYDVYFSIWFAFYLSAFYYKGKEEARSIVNKIMDLIRTNPGMRSEYEKDVVFYGDNFEHALM
jgi:hypothetical protein